MAAFYPKVDSRRATKLLAELQRLSQEFLPYWRGVNQEGNSGYALLRIASRLAEHVTTRLDQVPRRDTIAFFDTLDIPAQPPQSARAPVVFTLVKNRNTSVSIPPRIQIGAKNKAGTEVLFETKNELFLVPGKIQFAAAVDTSLDRIEQSPPGFLDITKPLDALPDYKLATLANANSKYLQITPTTGLQEQDLIRIANTVYQIEKIDEDVFTLVSPLIAIADVGTSVQKVVSFDTFALRDLQKHYLYIAHDELFNLEQNSIITLVISPQQAASWLITLESAAFEIYGKKEDEDESSWQQLDKGDLTGDELALHLNWIKGKVDKYEVQGEKSLWMRIAYDGDITTDQFGISISTLKLKVASKTINSNEEGVSHEGSNTISQAFHNSTPLPLTTRFFPFGLEPLRFDTFAISAPETLSKKGALATLKVTLVDSSLAALSIPYAASAIDRVYAIGTNGQLQAISLTEQDVNDWIDLGTPGTKRNDVVEDEQSAAASSYQLNDQISPQVVEVGGVDMIIVQDRAGRCWATHVTKIENGFSHESWKLLQSIPDNPTINELVILPRHTGGARNIDAYLFALTDDSVFRIDLQIRAEDQSSWNNTVPMGNPALGNNALLLPVLSDNWPSSSVANAMELLLSDVNGDIWRGNWSSANFSISWGKIGLTRAVSNTVKPAATKYTSDSGVQNFALYATEGEDNKLFAAIIDSDGNISEFDAPNSFYCESATTIYCLPSIVESPRNKPLAVAFKKHDKETPSIGYWIYPDNLEELVLPARSSQNIALLPVADNGVKDVRLFLTGEVETIYYSALKLSGDEYAFVLHDALILTPKPNPGDEEINYIEFNPKSNNTKELTEAPDSLEELKDGSRVYILGNGKLDNVSEYRFYSRPALPDDESDPDDIKPFTRFDGEVIDATHLKLHKLDNVTKEKQYVVIDEYTHYVESISGDNIATLDPPFEIPDTSSADSGGGTINIVETTEHPPECNGVCYIPVYVVGEDYILESDARQKQSGTLVELKETNLTAPLAVRFQASNEQIPDPATHLSYLIEQRVNDTWFLLAEHWNMKPAANAKVRTLKSFDAQNWDTYSLPREYENPELSWEYFDGEGWRRLDRGFVDETDHFANSGEIRFRVPNNITPVDIGGNEDYWIRARLVGGDYGRAKYIVTERPEDNGVTSQSIQVDTSDLNPPEILRIEAAFKLDASIPAQKILAENNLTILDQTQSSQVDGSQFAVFKGAASIDSQFDKSLALYFGFSKPFNVPSMSVFVDAQEKVGKIELEFEVLAREGWQAISAKDDSYGFYRRGYVQLSISYKPILAKLFGQELYWLRVSPSSDATQWSPKLDGIYINAGIAEQAKSVKQELLGSSLGEPNLQVTLSQTPILSSSLELRIREDLSEEEREELELNNQETDKKVEKTYENIAGKWVLWKQVDTFIDATGDSRVYKLDPATGEIRFGDGSRGKIPPAGADVIRAVSYQNGGGEQGNVDAYTITALKSAVESVGEVTNPIVAAGGVDAPSVDALIHTAPDRLRHRLQALTPKDIEALSVGFSADIVRARCLSPQSAGGAIEVVIAQRGEQRCYQPTLAQRDALAEYLRNQAWGALDDKGIVISVPDYVAATVTVQLIPTSSDFNATVTKAAKDKLLVFLHPTDGGPGGSGWPFGREVYDADILRCLADIPELDRITKVEVSMSKTMTGRSLVCSQQSDINVSIELAGEEG